MHAVIIALVDSPHNILMHESLTGRVRFKGPAEVFVIDHVERPSENQAGASGRQSPRPLVCGLLEFRGDGAGTLGKSATN
jgi:hypothetical protein